MINVAHTEAVGKADTLHYIITSIGTPTILIAKTHVNTTLKFDCYKVSQNSSDIISFHPDPVYVYALLLNRVGARVHFYFLKKVKDLIKICNEV